jgi:hypothetical protein
VCNFIDVPVQTIFEKMKTYLLQILFLFNYSLVISQTVPKNNCYQKTFHSKDKVFTKMEMYPHYKGYEDKLNQYLINEVDIQKIGNSLTDSIRIFDDTVKVKFIISRDGRMSDLTVNGNNANVVTEFEKALIKSSCNWVPGYSNRNLDGWYSALILFKFDRRGTFLSVSITTQRI